MGTDTPIAALSNRPRLLFDYFSQLFAQVTNPPLDAIREELVTSLAGSIGPEQNLLEPSAASCRQIVVPFPILTNLELAKVVHVNADGDLPGFRCALIDGRYRVHGGGPALAAACTTALPGPDLPEPLAPLALVVPGQLAAEALSRRLGLDPDAPGGLAKVTQTDGGPA
jgi:hypothetical protein